MGSTFESYADKMRREEQIRAATPSADDILKETQACRRAYTNRTIINGNATEKRVTGSQLKWITTS